MERALMTFFVFLLGALGSGSALAQPVDDSAAENQCILCHANPDVWEKETLHLFVTPQNLADDVHWQKGINCQECHGGNPATTNLREAHAEEDGFRTIESAKDIPDFCGHCHANAEYMQRFTPGAKTDQVARFWNSVHGRHLKEVGGPEAASCLACHPKHQMRASTDPLSSLHPTQLADTCGGCHKDQRTALRKGVHHAAGERNEYGRGTPLDCLKCHGQDPHGMVPARDPASPVALDHQVRVCGSCHEPFLATYDASVHGHGLHQSGLTVTAVCSDCHRAHDIYYAADRRSSLHATNVAATCGKCHEFIEDRLKQSVHGQGTGVGGASDRPSPGGKTLRHPSCVDCHQGHDQPHPKSALFQQQIPNRCGNCHADYALRYGMSLHGQLTELGYTPASKCSDCHGAHDILAASNPLSRVGVERRVQTCRQCHLYANKSFTAFDPHADPHNAERYPVLHGIYAWTEVLLYWVLFLFFVHALLWFARSFIHTLRFGRHRRLVQHEPGVVRFAAIERLLYALLIVSFLCLMLTGMPLKYSSQAWARRLADGLGGFETTSVWHHFFAVLLLFSCVTYLVRIAKRAWQSREQKIGWKQLLLGPDSPLPNARDGKDFLGMLRWFFGAGRKPVFERWTYWEKFDFWAVCLAMILIGGSGLLLLFPTLAARVFPGGILNVAHLLHSETTLLVGGCIFVIHFFHTHLRPEKFPMDLSVLTGVQSMEHLRTARPEYLERLRREGKLEQLQTLAPPHRRLRRAIVAGSLVIAAGLILLVWSLLAYLGK